MDDKSCQRQTLYKTYTSRYPLPQVQFSNEEKICQWANQGLFLLRENILFGDSLFLFDTEKDGNQSKTALVFCEYIKIVIFRKAGCTYTKPSWGAAEFKKMWHKRTLWTSQLKANLTFQNWNCRRSSVQWTSRWNLQNENGVLENICVTWRKKSSYLSCLIMKCEELWLKMLFFIWHRYSCIIHCCQI